MDRHLLRIHRFLPGSQANGPGLRAVLWVQGCSLGCPGCFNPETHPFAGGELVPVDDLVQQITAIQNKIEGLTISGGEPLQQRASLLALLQQVRSQTDLSILLFTGFSWPEVQQMPGAKALLSYVDVLIAGRYETSQRLARHLQGSANKTIHLFTDRYTMTDLQAIPPAEITITDTGEVLLSGIDPLEW